jgi:hypothetical protein
VGSRVVIGGSDSFDGPVGSGRDSAASRAGDSATGLGMTVSWPGAFESSLRDSLDDLAEVPGLLKLRADEDRRIKVPMRDRIILPGDDVCDLDMLQKGQLQNTMWVASLLRYGVLREDGK